MFAFTILAIVTSLVSLVPALPTADPVSPPAGGANLTSFNVDLEGSGCRPGEASVSIASDNSAMTIILDNFEAADGPKAGKTKSRAFCRVTIGIDSPGWAFDITSADFRGYVNIDKGVEASLVSRWKWVDANGVDMKGKGNIHKVITGPFEDDVLLHKSGELSQSESAVCQKKDAKIQISLSATVKASIADANGIVHGSSQDIGFGQVLNLSWRKC